MPSSKQKNLTGPYACIQALYWMYFAAIMSFSGFFLLPKAAKSLAVSCPLC